MSKDDSRYASGGLNALVYAIITWVGPPHEGDARIVDVAGPVLALRIVTERSSAAGGPRRIRNAAAAAAASRAPGRHRERQTPSPVGR